MDKRDISVESLQHELTDLKGEILELSRALASNASSAAESVGPAYEATKGAVRQTAQTVRDQGQAAVDVIRENPGTTTSVAVTAGLIGLALGYMLGSTSSPERSRWHL
ncbi:MAG: hypothetical protein JWM58_802 [Rhizobium sp.]|nr:hypothetical protein [Rhizobium sp.]